MKIEQKVIPVYVFNEHNEAFYYWQRARIEGYLQKALDLFHIDAHDDMAQPSQFRTSIHFPTTSQDAELDYYKRFAQAELNIGNFIFPAILTGVIKNVYFVYPKWRKFKPVKKKFSIGSAFGEGKVLKYTIKPGAMTSPMVRKAYPDLMQFHYFALEANKLPLNRKVILDIDMDYFACRDSTYNQMSYELEITQEQFKNKDEFLADKTLPFSGLEFTFSKRGNRFFSRIERKKGKDLFHFPTEDEIERDINGLVKVLMKKKIRPEVVTICRSCNSGFCPEEYSRFIESRLVERLQALIS